MEWGHNQECIETVCRHNWDSTGTLLEQDGDEKGTGQHEDRIGEWRDMIRME